MNSNELLDNKMKKCIPLDYKPAKQKNFDIKWNKPYLKFNGLLNFYEQIEF
jgi:hypothetical protein